MASQRNPDGATNIMPRPALADRVEVHVLVDNVTDSLSSVPRRRDRNSRLRRRRGSWAVGSCLCCAAHGLACSSRLARGTRAACCSTAAPRIERSSRTSRGSASISAPSRPSCCRTATGIMAAAMLRALQLIRERNGGREVPYYAHPGMFRTARQVRRTVRCAVGRRAGCRRARAARRARGQHHRAAARARRLPTSAARSRA